MDDSQKHDHLSKLLDTFFQQERAGKDTGDLNDTVDDAVVSKKSATASPPPDLTSGTPEFEARIEKIKALYEQTAPEQMIDLSNDGKMARYDAFLDLYFKTIYTTNTDNPIFLQMIDQQIGIPPDVFADRGADYLAVKAEHFRKMVETADSYSPNDARNSLMKEQGADPTDLRQIAQRRLEAQYGLYLDALDFYTEVTHDALYIPSDAELYVQQLAGVSIDHINTQMEHLESDAIAYGLPPPGGEKTKEPEAPDNNASLTSPKPFKVEDIMTI